MSSRSNSSGGGCGSNDYHNGANGGMSDAIRRRNAVGNLFEGIDKKTIQQLKKGAIKRATSL
jgi:hypothetical protein